MNAAAAGIAAGRSLGTSRRGPAVPTLLRELSGKARSSKKPEAVAGSIEPGRL